MKKYLLSLFAVVLAVGLSSYTPKTTQEWFNYDGNINGGGTGNPANYTLVSGPSCPKINPNLCEIFADRQPNVLPAKPNLDTEVESARTHRQ